MPAAGNVPERREICLRLCVVIIASSLVTHALDTASETEAVKRVIEGANAAVTAGKLEEVLAFYAADARIDSKAAGRLVSKDEFREALKGLFDRRSLNRADVADRGRQRLCPSHVRESLRGPQPVEAREARRPLADCRDEAKYQ